MNVQVSGVAVSAEERNELLIDLIAEKGPLEAVNALCALAEEQDGNPSDPLSERLYAIGHGIELWAVSPRKENDTP